MKGENSKGNYILNIEIEEFFSKFKNLEKEMLDFVIKSTNINSGSSNLEGLKDILEFYKKKFSSLNVEVHEYDLEPMEIIDDEGKKSFLSLGKAIKFSKIDLENVNYKSQRKQKNNKDKVKVLLLGHMDTVFEKNHPFQEVEYIGIAKTVDNISTNISSRSSAKCSFSSKTSDHTLANTLAKTSSSMSTSTITLDLPENLRNFRVLKGPGVADMKGGIAVMFFTLLLFEQTDMAKNLHWEVLLTPDEETGSFGSINLLKKLSPKFDVGLIFEPTVDLEGTIAGDRKGSGEFTIIAHGKSAHAGRDFEKGQNAICALSKIIIDIDKLNGQRDNVTINVGIIKGGNAIGVVPDLCIARIGVRYLEEQDEKWIQTNIEKIVEDFNKNNSKSSKLNIEMHCQFTKRPKKVEGKTKELYNLLKKVGKELNQDIKWKPTGGCCDGNNLSTFGLPNIDTLGVIGANLHSSDEYMIVESLVAKTKLTFGLLVNLSKKHLAKS